MKHRKIGVIGCGNVGNMFLYSAINSHLADEYIMIDLNQKIAQANVWDFEDTQGLLLTSYNKIKLGDYSDLKNCDILVITVGVAMKSFTNRLDFVNLNGKIMIDIADKVKASGFQGITIIASNPCDVLASIYQKETQFDPTKIVSSGTLLDSSRLCLLISKKIKVNPQVINAYLLGEHGLSSFVVWSHANIMGKTIAYYLQKGILTKQDLITFERNTIDRGTKIFNAKGDTCFGIGTSLTKICTSLLHDANIILPVGINVKNRFEVQNIYLSLLAVLNNNGVKREVMLTLTPAEEQKLIKSAHIIQQTLTNFYKWWNKRPHQ